MGFAVSDPTGIMALPLRVVTVNSRQDAVRAVSEIRAETEARLVVVGLPLNMDGTRGDVARKVDAFVADLRDTLDVPVKTWDERLSTQMIERTLIEADLSRARRKQVRDKLAAQVILQGYLDSTGMDGTDADPL